jgi:hypothetical protein
VIHRLCANESITDRLGQYMSPFRIWACNKNLVGLGGQRRALRSQWKAATARPVLACRPE